MSEELLQADVDWFPLVVFVLWVIGSILGGKKKRRPDLDEEYEWEEPPPQQHTEEVDRQRENKLRDVLREIEENLGLHTPDRPSSSPPQVETIRLDEGEGTREDADAQEWDAAPSLMEEAQRKSAELHRKKRIAEQQRAELARRRVAMQARMAESDSAEVADSPRSPLVASLLGDLTHDGESLSKAILLKEILGPPVGLRDP